MHELRRIFVERRRDIVHDRRGLEVGDRPQPRDYVADFGLHAVASHGECRRSVREAAQLTFRLVAETRVSGIVEMRWFRFRLPRRDRELAKCQHCCEDCREDAPLTRQQCEQGERDE